MATYNGEKYIEEQLQSILKQLGKDDEIVISDDGSCDETISIVNSLSDSRVKIFYNNGVHGFTRNFENALKYAKGDIIFLSDQDDIWFDSKVKIVLDELKRVDFVTHDCVTIDSDKNVLSKSRFEEFNIQGGFWRHMLKSRFLGCCMAFRRNVLETSMPFPKRDDLVEHDIWIAAVAFKYFKYSLVKEPLIYYRRHGKNASEGGFTNGYSFANKILRRIYRLYCLYMIRKKVNNILRR